MKILLKPYNPDWIVQFEVEQVQIERALKKFHPIIEHIGSTSIEGIWAKPVIDILVGIPDEKELDAVIEPMVACGYTRVSRFDHLLPYRRLFVAFSWPESAKGEPLIGDEDPRKFGKDLITRTHIHVIPKENPNWLRHIAFRDYLRAHPQIKFQYSDLKREIAKQDLEDSSVYNDLKDPFIKETERKALEWYNFR